MTPDELKALAEKVKSETVWDDDQSLRKGLETLVSAIAPEPEPRRATVILFKDSGKYYTEEEWRIPAVVEDESPARGKYTREVIGPYDMRHSPDFRRIDPDGKVLVVTQEPWGYPHLL